MQNKFIITTLSLLLLTTLPAQARDTKSSVKFKERKAEIISNLTKEKNVLDAAIACFTSAQDKTATKKCRAEKKVAKKALVEERKAKRAKKSAARKEKLQEKIKKTEERERKASSKK